MNLQLVEIAPGQLKPFQACSKSERARAGKIQDQKVVLMQRLTEFARRLEPLLMQAVTKSGVDQIGPRAASIPLTVAVFSTGKLPPVITLPVLEAELRELEGWIDELEEIAGDDGDGACG